MSDTSANNPVNVKIEDFLKLYPPVTPTTSSLITNKYLYLFSLINNTHKKCISTTNQFNHLNSSKNYFAFDDDYYLINKAIDLQEKNLKKTSDIRRALEKFLHNSSLIQKLKKCLGNRGDIEYKISRIISKLSDKLIFCSYHADEFILKMHGIGDNCYFLLSGELSVLKPVEYKNIKINYEYYFKYLISLLKKKEIFLLERIIEINWHFINLHSIDNFEKLLKYYCQRKICNIYESNKNSYHFINVIENYLEQYNLNFKDFNIEEDIKKKIMNITTPTELQTLNKYLFEKIKPSKDDILSFNPYNFLFDENIFQQESNRTVILYKYENFITLEPGSFFGDMALEGGTRRNASIRAETNCVILSLSNEVYNSLLMTDNKKLKLANVYFICNNFFFNNISPVLFNKYYFPMFKLINKKKNDVLYQQESECNCVYFLKDGIIKYEINSSIIDISNLIKFLIETLKNDNYLNLDIEFINSLKSDYFYKNRNFIENNIKTPILREKIKQIQKIEISLSDSYETFGILEYFMNIKHIGTCSILSTNAKLFEISKDNLNKIIGVEKNIVDNYYKLIHNKILALIKRLFTIQNIFIKQMSTKLDEDYFEDNKDFNYQSVLAGETYQKFSPNNLKLLSAMQQTKNNYENKTIINNFDIMKNKYEKNKNEKNKILSIDNIKEKDLDINNKFWNTNTKKSINIGNLCFSLPKLKKNIIFKNDKLNLSIVNNFEMDENRTKSLDNSKILSKKNNKLPKIQKSKLVNKNYFFKSRSTADLGKEQNDYYNIIEDKTIFAEFIKMYYNKRKQRGYSLLVDPRHNSIFKKQKIRKINENFFKY